MNTTWLGFLLGLTLLSGLRLSAAIGSSPEPSPEAAATSEPSPEGGAEPEPEPENTAEPEPETEPSGGPGDSPFAEPVPAWDDALPKYGHAWPFHIYLMGVLFALLAMYSLGSIIKLRRRRLLSYGYFIALNLLMLLMGTIRAIYLLVDAYNYRGIWPNVVAYILLGTGFPCLTSAFSILFMALLQSTKTRLVPPTIQKPKYLAVVITCHFVFAFIADVVVGLYVTASVLLLICQTAFVIWGLFLTGSYLVIFRRLYKSSVRKFREINRLSIRTGSVMLPSGELPIIRKPRNNWGSAIKVTLVTAILGLFVALLQVFGMLVVYGPVGGQKQIPDPWPWWTYQFIFRVLEFAMCALMSFVATQPFRYTKDGKEKPCSYPPCLNAVCGMCGRHDSHDFQQEEELNSQVWSSAFEPCLPQKPTMYEGLASNKKGTYQQSRNTNMNNASVNINTETWDSNDKVKYKGLKLDLGDNVMRKARSEEALGSEINNRVKSPKTAPALILSSKTLPDPCASQGQMVRNELQSSVRKGDKVTNYRSVPVLPCAEGMTEESPSHQSMTNLVAVDTNVRHDGEPDIEATEETPLHQLN